MNRLLTITTFLPLAGAVVLLIGGRTVRDDTARITALVTSVAAFIASLAVYGKFDGDAPGFQLVEQLSWVRSIGLQYLVGIDGVSLWLVLLTTFLFPISILASWRVEREVRLYLIAMLVLETAVIGTFVALRRQVNIAPSAVRP